ncbi:MAG TPA: serine/threonine-protein kinase [Thermodesulfobacteriota bacterium]|nr:serine/threonine-protein kinase [Thermodesulfobacteriota bacterium]
MKYGRYETVQELGKGGMGVVYKAHDPHIDRDVALKVLRQDRVSNDAFVQRFVKEAKAIGHLSHPNIVTVYDVGQDHGTIYLAMEFLEGQGLDKLEPSKLSVPEIVRLSREVAEALHYAHRRGVIHRDVKPSNIIVQPDGHIKITDFGIAHIEDPSGAVQTQAGEILGTPAYMSPEQVLSRPVDGRSDLFSLGVIMWEMATSQRPFKGENLAALFHAVTQEIPAAPETLNPMVPASLSGVIMRCLEKKPEDRFESGGALASALSGILEEVSAPRPKSGEGRSKFRGAYLAIAAGVIVLGGGSFYLFHGSKPAAPPPAKVVQKTAPAFLKVESTPEGAQIFVDGSFRGTTPGRLEVAAGKHEVRVVLGGYYDWEAQVEPAENSEFPLKVNLAPSAERK